MRDLAVVLITIDRSPEPSYLSDTLSNLTRGGLLSSPRVGSLFISDGGGSSSLRHTLGVVEELLDEQVWVAGFAHRVTANENVEGALRVGACMGAPWVLFLEDDIDVCADFFDSVGAWLDEYASPDHFIYPLGANYEGVECAARLGADRWVYPVEQFYGTQALAIRSTDAASLASFLEAHRFDRAEDGTAYDLLMADWLRAERAGASLLTPAPSFVQHIGRTSSIRPRPATHTFPSWLGREWSYLDRSTLRGTA